MSALEADRRIGHAYGIIEALQIYRPPISEEELIKVQRQQIMELFDKIPDKKQHFYDHHLNPLLKSFFTPEEWLKIGVQTT